MARIRDAARSRTVDADAPIIKLVNTTLMDALNRRASDIHIETGHEGLVIKYRIDGVLYVAKGDWPKAHSR